MNNLIDNKEFSVLETVMIQNKPMSRRELSSFTPFSLTTVHNTLIGLNKKGYVKDGLITQAGLDVMEKYSVKRAIIFAAHFEPALIPLTFNKPAPLIRINGVEIIDKLITSCLNIGIKEVYIVRGCLSDKFDSLSSVYPNIKFIDNPDYKNTGTISSAYYARDFFENAYIFDGSMLLENHELIKKCQYNTCFFGVKKDRSDSGCFHTYRNIIKEYKIGDFDCFENTKVAYFDKTDALQLKNDLEAAYKIPGGQKLNWENVPLSLFKKKYKISLNKCSNTDIIPINNLDLLSKDDITFALR